MDGTTATIDGGDPTVVYKNETGFEAEKDDPSIESSTEIFVPAVPNGVVHMTEDKERYLATTDLPPRLQSTADCGVMIKRPDTTTVVPPVAGPMEGNTESTRMDGSTTRRAELCENVRRSLVTTTEWLPTARAGTAHWMRVADMKAAAVGGLRLKTQETESLATNELPKISTKVPPTSETLEGNTDTTDGRGTNVTANPDVENSTALRDTSTEADVGVEG
jgi:hypothetical protein